VFVSSLNVLLNVKVVQTLQVLLNFKRISKDQKFILKQFPNSKKKLFFFPQSNVIGSPSANKK
jgi:hypothetical protein